VKVGKKAFLFHDLHQGGDFPYVAQDEFFKSDQVLGVKRVGYEGK